MYIVKIIIYIIHENTKLISKNTAFLFNILKPILQQIITNFIQSKGIEIIKEQQML